LSAQDAFRELQAGRPSVAVALLVEWLQAQPTDARSWFLLGACHHALNELGDAAKALSRSIAIDPSNIEAQIALVSVLRASGDAHGALAASRKALAQAPMDARILYAVALCLEDLGCAEEAFAHYETAAQAIPPHEDSLHNLGQLLLRLGRPDDAESCLRRYVRSYPDSPRAHSGLADALLAQGSFSSALECLRQLERLSPLDVSVPIRQGVANASLHRFDEAKACFADARARDQRAVTSYLERIAPGADPNLLLSPQNLYFWQLQRAQTRCDWSSWNASVTYVREMRAPIRLEPAAAFVALHLPLSGIERCQIATLVTSDIETRFAQMPLPPSRKRPTIRIGILSPDLREHLNGYLLLPLFELADRRSFELFAFSLAADDGSAIRAKLASSADQFFDVSDMSDSDAAALVRECDIDILIDVGGHTTGGRFAIMAQRPARVQAQYLGFPSSLGSSRIDHVIADRIVGCDPAEWIEDLVFLPHTFFLYDFRAPEPSAQMARGDYALPDEAFVFCAFHKTQKISPDVFDLWMRILSRVPSSVLWLLSPSDAARRNLRREAEARGVSSARLFFAPFDPRDRYLARLRLGNLMLDAFHHSAMTTACDAMAAGLPVLTIPGNAMASRGGESLARAAGVPEMVARDKEDYVEKAVYLAQHPKDLQRIRQKLLARTGPLFDTAGRVRELEKAFLEMWRRYEQRR